MKKMPFKKRTTLVFSLALAFVGAAQAAYLKTYDISAIDVGASFPSSRGGIFQTIVSNQRVSSLALLNEQGVPQWRRKIFTGGIDLLFSHELANGQIFVTGLTKSTTTNPFKAVWAKFRVNRATGNLSPEFRKTFQSSVQNFFAYEDPISHKLFGLGQISNSNGTTDILVSQINSRTGGTEWLRRLHSGLQDSVSQIFPITASGRFILLGETSTSADLSTSNQKILIGLLDRSGRPIADTFKKYGANNALNSGSLLPISDGNYLLIGSTTTLTISPWGFPITNSSAFVIKFAPDLSILWKKSLKGPTDSTIVAFSGIENSDGSFILNAQHTPAFSLADPLASSKQHPVTIKLSSTGRLINSKRYEFGDYDSGSFSSSPDGGYLFKGTMTTLNAQGTSQDSSSIYGKFNRRLQPVWNKALTGANIFAIGGIFPATNGLWVSGISLLSSQTNEGDLLLGLLNDNGNIPGCPEIEAITPTIVNAGISSGRLGWTPKAATVGIKADAGLVVQDLDTLTDRNAPLPTVNTLCN